MTDPKATDDISKDNTGAKAAEDVRAPKGRPSLQKVGEQLAKTDKTTPKKKGR